MSAYKPDSQTCTISTMDAKGLAYVLLEQGTKVSEDELNDWYTTEHCPHRLTLPGFLNASRYKAIDGVEPTWLTLYDLTSSELGDSPEYKAIATGVSERDKQMLTSVGYLNRRVYEMIGQPFTHERLGNSVSTTDSDILHPKYVVSVSLTVSSKEGAEDNFNRWYEEEHMALLSKVHGWCGGRRYKLVSTVIRGDFTASTGRLGTAPVKTPPKYLALHSMSVPPETFLASPEWKAATNTEWRDQVMQDIVEKDYRIFELSQVFRRPQ